MMGKTWERILSEVGKVPPEQTMQDKREMLEEKGMTWGQFIQTEECRKAAKKAERYRFTAPIPIKKAQE